MKKFLYLLFIYTLVALMVSCQSATPTGTPAPVGPTEESVSTSPTEAPQPTEKRVFHIQGSARDVPGQEEAWREVFAAFENEYNVDIEVRWQGLWSDIPQQLQTARMANEPVDITTCGANQVNSTLARSGVLMDITELIKPFQDRFVEGMIDPYTIGGKVWAMPWDVASTSVVVYNIDIFNELGLEEPTTYEDLVEAADTIKDQKGIMPWVHQGKAPWMWPMWFFESFAQTSGNQSIEFTNDFLTGNRKFNSPEEIAAFEALGKFYQDGVLTTESLDTDTEGMRAAFAQQKAAMMYVGTWEFPNIRDSVKDFEVGIFEFPIVTDKPGVVSQHGGGPDGCLAIPSFAPKENIDLQAQFLEFVSRAENANKILGPALPIVPVLESVPPVDDPLAPELNSEFTPHTIRFLDWIWPVEVNDAVMQAVPAVLVGEMSPEDAAANVQDAFDKVVVEKDYSFDWWTIWTADDWALVTPSSIPTIEVKE